MTNELSSKIDNYRVFNGGIAPYDKESGLDQYASGRGIDVRSNPREVKILPKTTNESGSVYTDLPMGADRIGNNTYVYDASGNIYTRTSAGSHSLTRSVGSSHGNGIKYFGEDDFLYYTSDKVIGRYGQVNASSPYFVDDFLGAEGGVPLNTHWIDLESGSSQYASRADTASLSITSDITIEATIKPESLPAVSSSMTIASKWDENGNIRSYKFDIYAISGYFGDGSDGALTISSDTTEAPVDSAATATSGTYTISATNGSFAAGQVIFIHQSRGTSAGQGQRTKIQSYVAGTITTTDLITATYTSGAQVRVLKQYTNVTIDITKTYSAKAWNGTVGGILAFLANGTVTINGTISSNGSAGSQSSTTGSGGGSGGGFRGGGVFNNGAGTSYCGEGTSGASAQQTTANGNGGGGAYQNFANSSGGGGGNGASGTMGGGGGTPGSGGGSSGNSGLTSMTFGGGGGGGSMENDAFSAGGGGSGGGIIFISCVTLTNAGSVVSNGGAGAQDNGSNTADGGGGAGGSILLKAQVATLGTVIITATGGAGGTSDGGAGAVGRIHLDYYTSYTGTTNPTLDVAQDNTLVTNTSYQLRFGVSSNGTANELLAKTTTALIAGSTVHVAVAWDASASSAEFFVNGSSIGSTVGAITSISDNASRFSVGCNFNNTAQNFFDGKVDEVRVYNVLRTESELYNNKETEIAINTSGLVAYYQFDNNADDSTANANNLTASGSPTYATDVPFSSPTTRLDLDQSLDTSGNTYALGTSLSETAANRQTFVPDKDPQKSIEISISDTGDDSDWTLTVHDSLNRTVASATVTHANLHTGDFEFVFSSVWRPVRGASYHFHLTATTTTGTPLVLTTSANDLETADFHTYYQFLVEDIYHPIEQMINLIVIGNERYVATYDASSYNPHRLVLPSGWRIRCFAKWQGYIAIGCWKGSNVYDYDQGIIFFWDGYSKTYNDTLEVPEGAINSMFGSQGTLFISAGYQGDILEYTGGARARKIKKIPKITKDKYVEVLPNAMCMWQALLRLGVAGSSDSSDVERGVYTIGRMNEEDPLAITYDYPISTGTRASTGVKVGFMLPVDKKLLIGRKDGTSYGVDVVDPAGSPFSTATIERDIKDYGGVWKEKQAMVVRADFKRLLSGETVRLKYKLDRASNWTEGSSDNQTGYAATAGDTVARLPISMGNHKEVQIAADLSTSVSTSPVILEITLEENLKSSEKIV